MHTTKISENIQSSLTSYFDKMPIVLSIVQKIHDAKGRALLVGGAVRDLLLGAEVKDFDIEVHGIMPDELEHLLGQFGTVSLVGKSFGVFKLHGLDVDWSLPRKDSQGRKPDVEINPFMNLQEAFSRRDVTMNAMGIDLVTYELIDPFGGYEDLKQKLLVAADVTKFTEDPLRFYRVMQFIGRFEMCPDAVLQAICKKMDVSQVSIERIELEFEKLMLRSKKPSLGLRWLKSLSRLSELFPELGAIVGLPQEFSWHPEGDVFEHAMQCLDAAAKMEYDTDEDKLKVLYAALCHDFGKSVTTEQIGGQWKSLGHSKEGGKLAKSFLSRITNKKSLIDAVCLLVRYHMAPSQFVASKAKFAAYKRLAKKLSPDATLIMLSQVALADKLGRNPVRGAPLQKKVLIIDKFLTKAVEAKVEKIPEPAVLQGRDLMGEIQPGPYMGEVLKKAYEIQIDAGIHDKQELKTRALAALQEE